jgi:hypothetical protein
LRFSFVFKEPFIPLVLKEKAQRKVHVVKCLLKGKLWGGEEGEVAQTMYTHVSKCKNDKMKKKKRGNYTLKSVELLKWESACLANHEALS